MSCPCQLLIQKEQNSPRTTTLRHKKRKGNIQPQLQSLMWSATWDTGWRGNPLARLGAPRQRWMEGGKKERILIGVTSPSGPEPWENVYGHIHSLLTHFHISFSANVLVQPLHYFPSNHTEEEVYHWVTNYLSLLRNPWWHVGSSPETSMPAFLPSAFAVESLIKCVAYGTIALIRHGNNSLPKKSYKKKKKSPVFCRSDVARIRKEKRFVHTPDPILPPLFPPLGHQRHQHGQWPSCRWSQ